MRRPTRGNPISSLTDAWSPAGTRSRGHWSARRLPTLWSRFDESGW